MNKPIIDRRAGRNRKFGRRERNGDLCRDTHAPFSAAEVGILQRGGVGHALKEHGICAIYVLEAADTGRVKIGASSAIARRVLNLQSGSSERINVAWAADGKDSDMRRVERSIHDALARSAYKLTGEWYAFSAETAMLVVRRAAAKLNVPLLTNRQYGLIDPIRVDTSDRRCYPGG